MIDNCVSSPDVQGRPVEGDSQDDGEQLAKGRVAAEEHIQSDKQAFVHLLKLGLADRLTAGKTINLDANEELSRIIPVLCTYFSREELIELFGKKATASFFEMYRAEMLQNLVLEGELQQLLHAFNQANIPLILFKGPALAYTVYPKPHLRTYHDIDALIQPADLGRAHELLGELGYKSYEEYRANALDKERTGYNYTLKRPDSWLEILLELHTAPHAGEVTSVFDREALWCKAQAIEILGEPTLTMNPVDHLLYLCWHYRFHWFSRLIWLYDIVVMVRTLGSTLDWAALVKSARRQRIATTLYYCLSWCRDLFGVTIPVEVFVQLRPPLACRVVIERMTMPEPAQALVSGRWQSRRILAYRAMVDSTPELIKVGLRVFFPTPVTLGRRYMDHSRLPLQLFFFLYYLIHPWLTIAKGVSYLFVRKRFVRKRL
jgi:Uncharacterised nucleotidyltransferase